MPPALSFGAAAAQYERTRPPYPQEALDWALPPEARTVLDLGAGTGKLSRELVRRGLEVVSVEPSEGMLEQLAVAVPAARVLAGSAESIPLPGASVDAVLVAQAWHWVDPVRAVPEVARVLRPGGRLVLLWNRSEPREPWAVELDALVERAALVPPDMGVDHPVVGAPFAEPERFDVDWSHEMASTDLVALVASRSYVIQLPDAQREALLSDVAELVRTAPGLAGRDVARVPYTTTTWRASLVG